MKVRMSPTERAKHIFSSACGAQPENRCHPNRSRSRSSKWIRAASESPGPPLPPLPSGHLGCSRIHTLRGRSLAFIEEKFMKKQTKKLVLAKETLANLKKLDG